MRNKLLLALLVLLALCLVSSAGYNRVIYDVPENGGEWDFSVKPNQDLDVLLKAQYGCSGYKVAITRMDSSDKEPLVRVNGEEIASGQSAVFKMGDELTIHIVNPGGGATAEFALQARSK